MIADVRVEGGRQTTWRVIRAPRKAVFAAWIDPNTLNRWWGCEEAVSVHTVVEPEVGGRFDHHVVTKDGCECIGRSRFLEIDPPRRLAYETEVEECPDNPGSTPMTVVVDFWDADGGTGVSVVHSGVPADIQEVVEAHWRSALERLDAIL